MVNRLTCRARRVIGVLCIVGVLQSCSAVGNSKNQGALSHSSQELFSLIDRADDAYRAAQWESATSLYRAVLRKVPDDPYIWFRLGNTLTQQEHYNQAIYAYDASLQRDARQPKPWINLSTTYLLGAQLATLQAWEAMAPEDPARAVVKERLSTLSQLLRYF